MLSADSRTGIRFGADLFDHGAWWEAHAIWEPIWRAEAPGAARESLQALIQAAAYLLKCAARDPSLDRARLRLKNRALERLDRALEAGLREIGGLDLERLRGDLGAHHPSAPAFTLHERQPPASLDTHSLEVP